jgi:hypothetical protein
VLAPEGGIMGIYSLSGRKPPKRPDSPLKKATSKEHVSIQTGAVYMNRRSLFAFKHGRSSWARQDRPHRVHGSGRRRSPT